MKFTIERNWIEVIGKIWMPDITCAQRIELGRYELDNIGEPTRENVEQWLMLHSRDFQHIIDFSATIGETVIPWNDPESKYIYVDCMYPNEVEA